jgi:putative endonuclease
VAVNHLVGGSNPFPGARKKPGEKQSVRTGGRFIPALFFWGTMSYFVYILESESTGVFYIGHTDNLSRRIIEHNDPDYQGTKYTKLHKGPWNCVYKEEFSTRSEAMRRERQIKAKKSRNYIEYLVASRQSFKGC